MYIYNWITFLYSIIQHNIVNQLYFKKYKNNFLAQIEIPYPHE